MNISLSDEGKKMSFKAFVKMFGKHFKTFSEKELETVYTELTGKKVGRTKSNSSKDKKV